MGGSTRLKFGRLEAQAALFEKRRDTMWTGTSTSGAYFEIRVLLGFSASDPWRRLLKHRIGRACVACSLILIAEVV